MTEKKAKEVKEVKPVAEVPATPIDINVASDTDKGVVQISNNVVGMVVRKFTLGVEGVVRFQQQGMIDGLFDVLSKHPVDKSIALDMQDDGALITVTLILKFGVNIPAVCHEVQKTIKAKVEELTGYPVAKVNVNVVDLDDIDEKAAKKAKEADEEDQESLDEDKGEN